MLSYLIFGFVLGFIIPFVAGRFGKIIPADPGLLLLRLFHFPRFPKVNDFPRQYIFKKKWKKLLLSGFFWGLIIAKLFFLSFYLMPPSFVIWSCIFCWILCISMVIDAEYWLLPDFFTIPLLLLGFIFVCQTKIGINSALMGSSLAYIISVLSVLLMGIFSKNPQLGGGDVKMITAIGAWLGILGLNYALILSFLFFIMFNLFPLQKKGAYGPALGIASIIVFFIMYIK